MAQAQTVCPGCPYHDLPNPFPPHLLMDRVDNCICMLSMLAELSLLCDVPTGEEVNLTSVGLTLELIKKELLGVSYGLENLDKEARGIVSCA